MNTIQTSLKLDAIMAAVFSDANTKILKISRKKFKIFVF
jgi:hypothetical protein